MRNIIRPTKIIARIGRTIETKVPTIEATNSPVETNGLPNPPVVAVDAPRTKTLEPCTAPQACWNRSS